MLPQEKVLLRVSLVISLIGLAIVIGIGMWEEKKQENGSWVNNGEGEIVVKGEVKNVQQRKSVTIVSVDDGVQVHEVVIFAKGKPVGMRKGNTIEVWGKPDEYKGKKQVVADEVKVY